MQSLMNENSDIDDDTAKECFTNLILAGMYTFNSKMINFIKQIAREGFRIVPGPQSPLLR